MLGVQEVVALVTLGGIVGGFLGQRLTQWQRPKNGTLTVEKLWTLVAALQTRVAELEARLDECEKLRERVQFE